MSEVKKVDASGSNGIKSEERSRIILSNPHIRTDDGDAKPPPRFINLHQSSSILVNFSQS